MASYGRKNITIRALSSPQINMPSKFELQSLLVEVEGLHDFDKIMEAHKRLMLDLLIHERMEFAVEKANFYAIKDCLPKGGIDLVLKLETWPFCVVKLKLRVFFKTDYTNRHLDLATQCFDWQGHLDNPNRIVCGVV
jgi:hypothetical protein